MTPRCSDCPAAGRCIVERTGHRTFCDWARRGGRWRGRVIEMSREAPPSYPSPVEQAGNLLGAIGRVASAVVHGEPVVVPAEVLEERRALCLSCEFNGEREAGGIRCTKCGCFGLKLALATEQCKLDPPKWGRWEKPDGD